jgi:hypothetical protein
VLYNPTTRKYVMYSFGGTFRNHSLNNQTLKCLKGPLDSVGVPIFTSDSLTSGYTYAGRMTPAYGYPGYAVWDLSLSYLDGKGYLVFTGQNMTATIRGEVSSVSNSHLDHCRETIN